MKSKKRIMLENRLRKVIRPIVRNVLREGNENKNINFVANKLSALAHQLHDYDFDVRNRKVEIEKMWNEVKDILNKYNPTELIDAVKYRGENVVTEELMPAHKFNQYLKTSEEAKEIKNKVKKLNSDIVVKLTKNNSPKKIGPYGVEITIPDEILTSRLSMQVDNILSDY